MKIKELAVLYRDDVQRWVDDFEKPGAAWKAYKTLRQIIRWAIVRFRLKVIDPTIGVEKPQQNPYTPPVLTGPALEKRVTGFRGHALEATTILSAALGLRPGENYALDWSDISMSTGMVRITKTLQQVKGKLYMYPPKTPKGWREVPLPSWAFERLREIWRDLDRPKGRIIGDLNPSTVASRIKAYAAKSKLPKISMQNLRHTWGTLAVEAGGDIATIASMMGHSDIATAYKYYIRLTTRAMRRIQRRMSPIFRKKKSRRLAKAA